MGKLRSNKAVGDLQGKVGGLVYVHRADGVVVVRRIPEHEAQSTGPELASQGRFTKATRYIKRLKANPDQYAPYQLAARIERKRACDLAMSDFLSAPVVNEVDLSGYSGKAGEVIRIQAVDGFGVSFLGLTLSHLDGVLIEQGPGVWAEGALLWTYLTQAPVAPGETVVVKVTAVDRAGNASSKSFHHALVVG